MAKRENFDEMKRRLQQAADGIPEEARAKLAKMRRRLRGAADGIPEESRAKLEAQIEGASSGAGAIGILDGSTPFPIPPETASNEEITSAIATNFLSAASIMGRHNLKERLIGALPGDPTPEFKRILAADSATYAAELLRVATLTPHNPTPIEIEACAAALDKVGEKGDDARAGLLEALRRHLDAWKGTVGDTLDELEDCAILPLDEALARYMAAEMGEPGVQAAGYIREAAAERMDAYTGEAQQIEALRDHRALWKLWALPVVGAPLVRGLSLLARVAWDHEARVEVETARHGLAASVVVLGKDGDRDQYAGIQKAIAPVAWAFGGEGNFVDIGDGDQYAATPDAPKVAIVPRSYEILANDHDRFSPKQGALPLHYPGNDPLVWAIVKQARGGHSEATGALPSAHAGKLALLTLACTLQTSRPAAATTTATGSLEQWTHAINPSVRYIQKTHLKSTAAGLIEMEAMVAVDPANHSRVRCFDMQVPVDPDRPRKETVVEAKMGGLFSETVWRQRALETGKRDSFKGFFVINLTGAMRLPVARPALLRHYIRAALGWNDAHGFGKGAGFVRERLPWVPLDDWLAVVNQLGQRTVDLLKERRGSGSRYQGIHRNRKKGQEDLDRLYDGAKLIEIETRGKGGKQEIRVLPTEGIVEAWDGFGRKARRRKV